MLFFVPLCLVSSRMQQRQEDLSYVPSCMPAACSFAHMTYLHATVMHNKAHRESGFGKRVVDDALMESCRTWVVMSDDSRMSTNTSSCL